MLSADLAARQISQNAIAGPKITMPPPKSKERIAPGALEIKCLADIAPERIEWLWPGRIAYGKLNLVFGRKAGGKSFLTSAIAKAVTRGERLPGDNRPPPPAPADVLFICFEDGLGDTLRPRMERLGVNLSRVHVWTAAKNAKGEAAVFGPDYLPKIEDLLIANPAIGLVVLDPVMSILGGIDVHRDNEVRNALQPLVGIAQRCKVAVLLVAHTRKAKSDDPLDALAGSVAFANLTRSVLYVGSDPHDSERRAVVPVAGNLAGDSLPIAFRIASDDKGEAVFTWEGQDENLDAWTMSVAHNAKPAKMDEAKQFLAEALVNSPAAAKSIEYNALQRGIRKRTLERAKDALGVVSSRTGFGGSVVWSMPLAGP